MTKLPQLLVSVTLLILAGCETTRTNMDKSVTRPTYCYPVDRC